MPALQIEQNESPRSEFVVPAGQIEQKERPLSAAKLPTLHGVHVVLEFAPARLLLLPGGHGVHELASRPTTEEYEPRSHATHAAASEERPLSLPRLPAAHWMHELWSALAYRPAGHLLHPSTVPTEENEPSGHGS